VAVCACLVSGQRSGVTVAAAADTRRGRGRSGRGDLHLARCNHGRCPAQGRRALPL